MLLFIQHLLLNLWIWINKPLVDHLLLNQIFIFLILLIVWHGRYNTSLPRLLNCLSSDFGNMWQLALIHIMVLIVLGPRGNAKCAQRLQIFVKVSFLAAFMVADFILLWLLHFRIRLLVVILFAVHLVAGLIYLLNKIQNSLITILNINFSDFFYIFLIVYSIKYYLIHI